MALRNARTDAAAVGSASLDCPSSSKGNSSVAFTFMILMCLTLQNSSLVLLARASRLYPAPSGHLALVQTNVCMQECFKAISGAIGVRISGESFSSVTENKLELLQTGFPAVLYVAQNNLMYLGVSHLDAATYAVLSQMKILSTAVFSVFLLGSCLKTRQWLALALLLAGVLTSQLDELTVSAGSKVPIASGKENTTGNSDRLVGIFAVICVCTCSGLASVYFEKILKSSQLSVWGRNVQLACYSLTFSSIGLMMSSDRQKVLEHGMFQGYTLWTWASIINQSFGGLLTAVVMKYADNIAKNFALSVSLLLTATASAVFMNSPLGPTFVAGALMVGYSILLYSGVVNFGVTESTQQRVSSITPGPHSHQIEELADLVGAKGIGESG